MASSYRERVYLGIDEEGHEIIKWASGDSKWELHDSIVRLYVKYGKIDRFLAEVRPRPQESRAGGRGEIRKTDQQGQRFPCICRCQYLSFRCIRQRQNSERDLMI